MEDNVWAKSSSSPPVRSNIELKNIFIYLKGNIQK